MTNSGIARGSGRRKRIAKQTQSMDNIQYFNHLVAVKDGLCALMFGELTVAIEPLGTTTFPPNQTAEPWPSSSWKRADLKKLPNKANWYINKIESTT